MTRILIAAGGTTGHVAPALAVADVLSERGAEVVFAGTPDRVEATMVPQRGYRFETYRVSGFDRHLSRRTLRTVGYAAQAPIACARILRRTRPDAVLGAGGYVAGPMVAAAAAYRLPAVLTESDSRLGLANRMAAPLARRVLLAFPIPGLTSTKYRVVGRPVAPAFFTTTRAEARAAYGIDDSEMVVSVFGGSLGAGSINAAVTAAFGGDRGGPALVLHVTGRGKLAGIEPNDRYRIFEYCDALWLLLACADVVVLRAGGSLFEVAAAARPAILIPWPGATGDHQAANARYFVDAGAAVLLPDAELHGQRLRREVEELLADPARRGQMSTAMRQLSRPDAAADVADELLALARAPGPGA